MSRMGKYPLALPTGVQATLNGMVISVKGKNGQATYSVPECLDVQVANDSVSLKAKTSNTRDRVLWGTARSVIGGMIKGVSEGYTINLEIVGVGYRAALQGTDLVLQLGYSHDVRYPAPAGITFKCEKPTAISIFGASKQQVGQVAAEIRALRAPEPYKGKGIKYKDEKILRKEGKKK